MYFIVIRKQRDTDTPQLSELVRNAYTSNVTNMFWGTVFNEATLQITIILIAILFIFFQINIFYCLLTAPLVLCAILVFVYGAVTMKSAQIMYEKKPVAAWVAEVYEPYFQSKDPKMCWYNIISENELSEFEGKPEGRKKIIGSVAVMRHAQRPEWAWLYRLTVDKRYSRKGIGLSLVKEAQEWCKNNKFNRIELAMSEYNEGARQLFDKAGFEIKQLYHKKQLSSLYMLQMYLLTVEVRPTFN